MNQKAKLFVLLACIFAVSYAQTRCWYDYAVMKKGYLPECVDGCRDYGTLDAAAEACDKNSECVGVSNEFKSNGGSNSVGPNSLVGWQLRKGSTLSQNKYNQQGYTFFKGTKFCNVANIMYGGPIFDYTIKKSCIDSKCTSYNNWMTAAQQVQKTGADASVTYSSESWVPYKGQTLSASDYGVSFFVSAQLNNEYTQDSNQYYDEKRGYVLGTCVDSCRDYASLKEAQYYCTKKSDCVGVSYSNVNLNSGSNSVGYVLGYGYQLRKGSLTASSSTITWVKQTVIAKNPEVVVTVPEPETPQTDTTTTTPTTTEPTTTTPTTTEPTTTTPVQVCVYLYKECDYQGEKLEVCSDSPDVNWKQYKSMQIPANRSVTLFENDNYDGKAYVITQNVTCSNNLKSVLFTEKNLKKKDVSKKLKKNNF